MISMFIIYVISKRKLIFCSSGSAIAWAIAFRLQASYAAVAWLGFAALAENHFFLGSNLASVNSSKFLAWVK
jgi:hypothetical protein